MFTNILKLNTQCDSFRDAVQQIFALYSILNRTYPKTNALTLEFMQRCFLKIHPDEGNKNTKSMGKFRIVSLLNKLRDVSQLSC